MIPVHVVKVVNAALDRLPHQMDSAEARVMMYAIGLQESRFINRRQLVNTSNGVQAIGPAVSYWQFERGGGCAGVLRHRASRFWMVDACNRHGVVPTPSKLWTAMQDNDELGATAARLLLFTDPKPLPRIGDLAAAWDYYVRNWRPGKPHHETWARLYQEAVRAV